MAAVNADPFRVGGGPVGFQARRDNNMPRLNDMNIHNIRTRLFHVIYFRFAVHYAQIVPPKMRLLLEYFMFFKAMLFFVMLIYVHNAFVKQPSTCLKDIGHWPREGVLRLEVVPNTDKIRALFSALEFEEELIWSLKQNYFNGFGPQPRESIVLVKNYERLIDVFGTPRSVKLPTVNRTAYDYAQALSAMRAQHKSQVQEYLSDEDYDHYIVEYSLEYGYLRLSPEARKRLKIPVKVVQLDPETSKCFGNKFSRFLLRDLLGYDDLLMSSMRVIAEKEDNKGFLRNVMTSEHYRLVTIWWASWTSLPIAALIMVLFTLAISTLLRFSHHQIFMFIVDFLQMLEFNVRVLFPIAPLFTVVLALIGMETIMSEFFNCSTTTFYIILTVWFADQFDAICAHTATTKKHWPRFFFLYHFFYYAYHYRFSGMYRSLALTTSWLFVQHSMIYFFHHYELPAILQREELLVHPENPENPEPFQQFLRRTVLGFNEILRWQVGFLGQRLGILRELRQREVQRLQRYQAPRLRAIGTVRISGGRIQNAEDLIRRLDEETRRWHQEQGDEAQALVSSPPATQAAQTEQQTTTAPHTRHNTVSTSATPQQRQAATTAHRSRADTSSHAADIHSDSTQTAAPVRFGVAIGNQSFIELPLVELARQYISHNVPAQRQHEHDVRAQHEDATVGATSELQAAATSSSTSKQNNGAALPATLTTNTSTTTRSLILNGAEELNLNQQGTTSPRVVETKQRRVTENVTAKSGVLTPPPPLSTGPAEHADASVSENEDAEADSDADADAEMAALLFRMDKVVPTESNEGGTAGYAESSALTNNFNQIGYSPEQEQSDTVSRTTTAALYETSRPNSRVDERPVLEQSASQFLPELASHKITPAEATNAISLMKADPSVTITASLFEANAAAANVEQSNMESSANSTSDSARYFLSLSKAASQKSPTSTAALLNATTTAASSNNITMDDPNTDTVISVNSVN